MSWQARDYAQGEYESRGYRRPTYYGSGLGGLSVVTVLIIANVVVYFLSHMANSELSERIMGFGLMQAYAVLHGQVWRLFTATYLHANFTHIFVNMLGLYFFGPALERVWGARQFFLVYTLGGIFGNILLTLAGLVGFLDPEVLGLGASGSVLTLLGAAAVLFPNAQVYVYFLFPLRIRTFVLIYAGWFVWNIVRQGSNFGGDICHAGGLIVGLWWAYTGGISLSGRHRTRIHPGSILGGLFGHHGPRQGPGAWDHRMQVQREDEELVNRILDKVRHEGIQSLTVAEKEALQAASERRRREEEELRERDRM